MAAVGKPSNKVNTGLTQSSARVILTAKGTLILRASIRQVAEAAGVSPMTVSNVLRGRTDLVAAKTRERVLTAVHSLDYIPVRTAAQNRHVRTNAFGVVFLALHRLNGIVGYPTFQGMCERGEEADYDLTVFLRSEPDWVKPGSEARFLDRRCDGFIFVGSSSPALSETLVRHGIPAVECYSALPKPGIARVIGDNRTAMHQAVRHLARAGHTRIAHLAGPWGNREADERLAGFQEAMQDTFGPECAAVVVRGDTWGGPMGFHEGRDVVDMRARPLAEAVLESGATAAVCANDLLALTVWQVAEERGLRVPEDLSLVGMDNITRAAYRGLTTIATPFEQIGRAAVDALLMLQDGSSAEDVSRVLPVALVERVSVCAPASS